MRPVSSIGCASASDRRRLKSGAPASWSAMNSAAHEPSKQRWSVSDTAEYGDYTSGPKVIDDHVRATMKDVLARIQDGSWAAEFIADQDAGAPDFKRRRAEAEAHPIEQTGRELRGLMSWVSASDDYTGTAARG